MRGLNLAVFMLIIGGLFFIAPVNNAAEMTAAEVQNKVQQSIAMTYLGNNDITVDVNDDHKVTLDGTVETLYDKRRAFEAVAKTNGVKMISNQIVVQHKIVPEKTIEQNIEMQLKIDASVPEWENIEVAVDNGVVFLRGNVSFYHEKMIAEDLAATQAGVKSVVNEIEVKPLDKAISDSNLENYLMEIVNDHYPNENDVMVDVKDGEVTIKGEANSLWAAYSMEEEFADVIGVRDIDNMLLIEE